MTKPAEIWALRIVQNWNQVQYVVGREPEQTTQGSWIDDEPKKVTEIKAVRSTDEWNSGYVIWYDNGSCTLVSLATEGLIVEQRPLEVSHD